MSQKAILLSICTLQCVWKKCANSEFLWYTVHIKTSRRRIDHRQVSGRKTYLPNIAHADRVSLDSNITPLPALLQEHARKKQWEEAIRLCRYVNVSRTTLCSIGGPHERSVDARDEHR